MLAPLLVLAGAMGIDGAVFDELDPLFRDSPLVQRSGQWRLDAPRGSIVGVHLLCHGLDSTAPLELDIQGSLGEVTANWYRLHDVPVEENTGPESRTERWDKAENPHVIRRAPFRVYEAMEPVGRVLAGPGETEALRLEFEVTGRTDPGELPLVARVHQGDAIAEFPLVLSVHRATVPPASGETLAYTNWFSPANMAVGHELVPWSEAHWAMMGRYAELMARGRQTMFWVRWSDFFSEHDGQWVLDEHRLQRYVNLFTDAGLHWIEGAPIAGRPGGDWSRADLELKLGRVPLTGPRGRLLLAEQAAQIRGAIEANGWTGRWVQHIADEPTDVNARDYRVGSGLLREHLPGVPVLEATMSRALVGAIDAWCPQVQAWQADRDFFDERRAAGEQVWVYTCLRPGGPWLNRLLDQERLRPVYFGWGAAANDWDGYLHWGLNQWKADPFQQSVVDHPAMPGTDNRLPAGDTHVVYPGPDAPWSGVRFEAHRIGMEDRELLEQIQARDPQRAASIIARVYRRADDFEKDVTLYRAARRDLLEALDDEPVMAHIEVLGFPGCPMTPTIQQSVRAAMAALAPGVPVEMTDLAQLPADDPRLRWPAPTVLVDGIDLFGGDPSPRPGIACRIYPGGLPDAAAVRAALRAKMKTAR